MDAILVLWIFLASQSDVEAWALRVGLVDKWDLDNSSSFRSYYNVNRSFGPHDYIVRTKLVYRVFESKNFFVEDTFKELPNREDVIKRVELCHKYNDFLEWKRLEGWPSGPYWEVAWQRNQRAINLLNRYWEVRYKYDIGWRYDARRDLTDFVKNAKISLQELKYLNLPIEYFERIR